MITELWDSYSNQVFYFLNNKIKDDELARDLLQDTFQKVLLQENQLAKVNNPKAWLFRIARNTLIDYTRKKKEERLMSSEISDSEDASKTSKSAAEDIAECLYELIEEYNEEDRELLMEIFTDSLSQKEAAAYLNVPYSTLKSRIQKARNEILQAFESRCCRLMYNQKNEIIGCKPVYADAHSEC